MSLSALVSPRCSARVRLDLTSASTLVTSASLTVTVLADQVGCGAVKNLRSVLCPTSMLSCLLLGDDERFFLLVVFSGITVIVLPSSST